MILAMVRHGQTHFNINGIIQGQTNTPLNEVGRLQAHKVADTLKLNGEHFDAILSSPLSRALETAHTISKKLEIDQPIHVIQRFMERDFYHLDGKPVDEGMPLVRTKGYTYPGYEDDHKLIQRIITTSLALEKSYKDQKVLCVAHSHVIKSLLVYLDPVKYSFSNYLINNCDILYFEINNKKIKFIEHQKND